MNKELLKKTAEFHKLAIEEIHSLRNKVAEYEKAAEIKEYNDDKFEVAVKKAADILYEADFITDRYAYRDFVKKATIDPSNLVKALEKVCAYQEVSSVGTPSSVTSKVASKEERDPIYEKVFGVTNNSFNLLDD